MTRAWGLKIYLQSTVTADTTVGIYTDSIRWIEAPIDGTAEAYTSGMIDRQGIPAIVENGDIRQGGGVAVVEGMTIQVNNASQLWKTLEDKGIYLNGLRCDIIEFERSGATTTETSMYRGVITTDNWTITQYGLRIEPAYHNRNAQTCDVIDSQSYPNADEEAIGKVVPMTLGEFTGDRYAKLVRTANKIEKLSTEDFVELASTDPDRTYSPGGVKYFPVMAVSGSPAAESYSVAIGDTISSGNNSFSTANPGDLYMRVVKSDTDAEGEVRPVKIAGQSAAFIPDTTIIDGYYCLEFELTSAPFSVDLTLAAPDNVGTYIEIWRVTRQWSVDSNNDNFGGFLEKDGSPVEGQGAEVYAQADAAAEHASKLDRRVTKLEEDQ